MRDVQIQFVIFKLYKELFFPKGSLVALGPCLCFRGQISTEQQLFSSTFCYSGTSRVERQRKTSVQESKRRLVLSNGLKEHFWGFVMLFLLFRVDKAEDRVKLCAAWERRWLSSHSFWKRCEIPFKRIERDDGCFSFAGSEDWELEMVRPFGN